MKLQLRVSDRNHHTVVFMSFQNLLSYSHDNYFLRPKKHKKPNVKKLFIQTFETSSFINILRFDSSFINLVGHCCRTIDEKIRFIRYPRIVSCR